MTDNVEASEYAPFVVTLKQGAGFEAPWLVLRGASAEDVVALLGEAQLNELPKLIGEFAASFRDGAGAAPASGSAGGARTSGSPSVVRSARPSTPGAAAQPRGAAPQAPAGGAEQHPEGLTCAACGETVVYKKINKGSRSFELWTCPNQRQRNDGHHSEFIN